MEREIRRSLAVLSSGPMDDLKEKTKAIGRIERRVHNAKSYIEWYKIQSKDSK